MQIANRWARLMLALFFAGLTTAMADTNNAQPTSSEQKFVAMLIWGTDGEKPDESAKPEAKRLKDVDAGLREKFKKIFKWKNYYEVNRKPFVVKKGEATQIELSEKCQVKINHSEQEGVQVELIGEGKSVVKQNRPMPLRDILILAGDDKNATAWFVVLKPE